MIDPHRVAILRGKVTDAAGAPLAGVAVSVVGHGELGSTQTGASGIFDMAVNGGGTLRLRYVKQTYLKAERQVDTQWGQFSWAPEVGLLQPDAAVTTVQANAAAPQIARGTAVTDARGARRATVIFPAGTLATMTLAGGTQVSLSTLNVRATEFTVGSRGPIAMPASLPPTSGYTYAVSLSVDEAENLGATQVSFSQPVSFYIENFLGFPAGSDAPLGTYDPQLGAWVPMPSGRVIKILSVTNGVAAVDTDGDGIADSGLLPWELQQLGGLYAAGTSLWRLQLPHFSNEDPNLGWLPTGGAPWHYRVFLSRLLHHPCESGGSIIACEDQALGEDIPLTGTGVSLHYGSERAVRRTAERTLQVPLSGDVLPDSLKRIELDIEVAGQRFHRTFTPSPNLSTTYTWDGRDAYGRLLIASTRAVTRVGYVYPVAYTKTPKFMDTTGVVLTSNPTITEITLTTSHEVMLQPAPPALAFGPSAWSLSEVHALDLANGVLYLGDGHRQTLQGLLLDATARHPVDNFEMDPEGIAAAPDGTVYVADASTRSNCIRKIAPDGTMSVVTGMGTGGYSGDEGPASAAQLKVPLGVALGPDGSLYIADSQNARVRKIDPAGVIHTVISNFTNVHSVAVAADGTVYAAGPAWVKRLGTDGTLTTVAGNGTPGGTGDNGPASAALVSVTTMALGPDGSIYLGNRTAGNIRRITPGGIIQLFAGAPNVTVITDGLPALSTAIGSVRAITVGRDGSVYIADDSHVVVRRILPDTTLTRIVGIPDDPGFGAEGNKLGAPMATHLHQPQAIAPGPDGSILFAEGLASPARVTRLGVAGFIHLDGNQYVPSEDGSEVFVFDAAGRHVRTANASTGDILLTIGYDATGHVSSLTDPYGNLVTFDRSVAGRITVTAPYGQQTVLALDADGNLASVTDPAGMAWIMTYRDHGDLLALLSHPATGQSTFEYDLSGRLTQDTFPNGGYKRFSATRVSDSSRKVTLTTALGRTADFTSADLVDDGAQTTVTTAGFSALRTVVGGGSGSLVYADAMAASVTTTPDPVFGAMAPLIKDYSVTTPSGVHASASTTRTATLADPANPLSVQQVTATSTVNGNTWTSQYDASTRIVTTTSPEGRQATAQLDGKGRVTRMSVPGIDPIYYTYDTRGRLFQVQQGNASEIRTTVFGFDAAGLVRDATSDGEQVAYTYDAIARPRTLTLPDSQVVGLGYSSDARQTTITPPGRSAHTFVTNPAVPSTQYIPPVVDLTGPELVATGDLDRMPSKLTGHGGDLVTVGYDNFGRIFSTVVANAGTTTFGYDSHGLLGTITAPSEQTTFTYDGAYPTISTQSGTVPGTVTWSWDNFFRPASESIAGASVAYTYDRDGLLTSAGNLILGRQPATGLLSSAAIGTLVTTFGRNHFGEIDSASTVAGATALFSTQVTLRDLQSRILTRTETIQSATHTYAYHYDTGGRLTDVDLDGINSSHYEYDANGNRTLARNGGVTITSTTDAQDRLRTSGTVSYTYTNEGQVRTRTDSATGSSQTFTWDGAGNLLRVDATNPAFTVEYLYDGLGRRIARKQNGAFTNRWLYGLGPSPIAELDANGQVTSRYVYGLRSWVPSYIVRGASTYALVTDAQGSVRLVVDTATNSVVQRLDYDEFGKPLSDSNPSFQPFAFGGGLRDPTLGTIHFGGREYDPSIGRWTAKDPIGFDGGSTNLYAYVQGDPINSIDPSGLLRWPSFEDIGNGIAGFGDCVTLGLTRVVRRAAGWDDVVNPCSGWYLGGTIVGFVYPMVLVRLLAIRAARVARGARLLTAADEELEMVAGSGVGRKRALEQMQEKVAQLEKHLDKIAEQPASQDVNHWAGEARGWIDFIEGKVSEVGAKTAATWERKLAEWRARLPGGG